ncbi:nicotinamidase-related amidase [Natronocella acetinitrilica]|uniref:Nicotinamidase-related amidase n=1 Tax=Natronocella acetinitrilica TaxID=414046 RepID=A0AAE3KEY7_9GAMM|nr:isochorismatase family cysteine hydrolase [Natronocella acetinitrilica]MCP1673582.1 nicotinamidase-related amidase [Natronocella acetinitrilica]
MAKVSAFPFVFPHEGELVRESVAFIVIDMQRDFCDPEGYVARKGYDLTSIRAAIPTVKSLLSLFRSKGIHIVHTREGYAEDLSDIPSYKLWRSRQNGDGVGAVGPLGRLLIRGEPGWEILPELAPLKDERVIDKPGTGTFFCSDLETHLRSRGISNLIIAGVTTEVCVHSTVREAIDRGFNCLVVEDACGAVSVDKHQKAIDMITTETGIFGCTVRASVLIKAIKSLPE